jgi:hypothetical protein
MGEVCVEPARERPMAYETVGHETLAYARRFLLAERLRHERALVVEEQRQVLTAAAIGETREHLASIEAALALLPQEPAAKAAEAETPLAPGDVVAEAPAAPEAEPEAPPVLTLVSPATLGLGAAPEAAPSLEDAAPEPPVLRTILPPGLPLGDADIPEGWTRNDGVPPPSWRIEILSHDGQREFGRSEEFDWDLHNDPSQRIIAWRLATPEDAPLPPPELGAIQPPEDAEEERPFWATAGAVE